MQQLWQDIDSGEMTVEIFTDGASRGNPGDASIGVVLSYKKDDVKQIERFGIYLGTTTNNVAEYCAIIVGLARAHELNAKRVFLFADSELICKQLDGSYKVRSEKLQKLYSKVKKLMSGFEEVKISHVFRRFNKEADAIANIVIDLYRNYIR